MTTTPTRLFGSSVLCLTAAVLIYLLCRHTWWDGAAYGVCFGKGLDYGHDWIMENRRGHK